MFDPHDLQPSAQKGVRPVTAASEAATRLADAFEGLPEGMTRWRLATALRAAAPALDLSASMLRLLLHYIDLSFDADWSSGAEPVIARPMIEIAEHLGKTERQIRNLERALVARGLLAWRDSGNHRRVGRRDPRTKRWLYAYGPTLAPLGTRAAEIVALAERSRQEAAERRRARLAIGALKRRLKNLIAAEAVDPETGRAMLDALPRRETAGAALDDLLRREAALLALHESWTAVAATQARPCDIAPGETAQAEIRRRPYTSTTKDTESVLPTAEDRSTRSPYRCETSETRAARAAIAEAAAAMLARQNATPGSIRTWTDLADVARRRLIELGVTQEDWGDACAVMGRERASMCAIVIDAGASGDAPRIARPAGYLRALTLRAENGTLRIERSIAALARRRRGDAWTSPQDSRGRRASDMARARGGGEAAKGGAPTARRPWAGADAAGS